jgi:N-acyl-D-aspartate/D-glutamate deacylase
VNGSIALRGVRVFPGHGDSLSESCDVFVRDGLIASIVAPGTVDPKASRSSRAGVAS